MLLYFLVYSLVDEYKLEILGSNSDLGSPNFVM